MLLQMAFFVLFYGWVVFHCIYMYHIFFIHSSVSGHLGCSHVLVIVNSAAVHIGVELTEARWHATEQIWTQYGSGTMLKLQSGETKEVLEGHTSSTSLGEIL